MAVWLTEPIVAEELSTEELRAEALRADAFRADALSADAFSTEELSVDDDWAAAMFDGSDGGSSGLHGECEPADVLDEAASGTPDDE